MLGPRDAELTLRQYFENSMDLYCEIDDLGVFLFINDAWTKILGYPNEEILGRPYTEFLHKDDILPSEQILDQPPSLDRGFFKNRYLHKDGHYITLLWSAHIDDRYNRYYAHARDISKDVRRSTILRCVAEIQLAYLSHASDAQDLYKKVLPAIQESAECEGASIVETPLEARPEDSGNLNSYPNSTGSDKNSESVQIPLMYLEKQIAVLNLSGRRSGFNPTFLEELKPVLEATASVLGLFQTSVREIRLRERFSVIVENLPIMLTEFGQDSRVTWANRYYREKIGWSEEDILKNDLIETTVGTPEGDTTEPTRAREFMRSGRTDWQDFTLKNSHGEWFPSTWTNVQLSDGRAIGIGQDLTDRQAAEAKMIQSSKMASLGEMSAGVSHEINNPLTIIQGSAFRALQNLTGPAGRGQISTALDDVEGDLNRIIQNCDRIARIVRGLRAFSRTDEHEPMMPIPLISVIDDVLNLATERFRIHNIHLDLIVDRSIVIDARPVLLGQVLMNLLNNAFDAVENISPPRSKKIVTLKVERKEENIELSVEDNGPGISSKIQNRIFEPFFTTKEVGKGTGLGLSISKGIIESHSGKLSFESSKKGTKFIVSLPLKA